MYSRTVLAVAIIYIFASTACTENKEEVEPVGPYIQTFVVKDSVEYAFQVNGNVFASLDTVQMLFRVKNLGSNTAEFGAFNGSYYCGFAVREGNSDIWQSCRVPPPGGLLGDTLKPGETRMFGKDWNTMSDNGTYERDDDYPVPPGTYTLAASPGMARAEEVELMLTIHIVD